MRYRTPVPRDASNRPLRRIQAILCHTLKIKALTCHKQWPDRGNLDLRYLNTQPPVSVSIRP